ncbi:unnamed protein product [Rodentolepis nana]|uniref:G_PROTEIN_RECEP_F2_4 domain-containing protein n=1 Tax=Rodentolepis nana TaxID=102285 RepID=A0A0R3TCS9_RODNA|nr:unnamed protein product [Rodentolepis nana]
MLGQQWKISQIFLLTAWYFVTPCFMLYLFVTVIMDHTPPIFSNGQPFPQWTVALGWCIALVSIVPIPLFAVAEIWKHRKNPRNVNLNVN